MKRPFKTIQVDNLQIMLSTYQRYSNFNRGMISVISDTCKSKSLTYYEEYDYLRTKNSHEIEFFTPTQTHEFTKYSRFLVLKRNNLKDFLSHIPDKLDSHNTNIIDHI